MKNICCQWPIESICLQFVSIIRSKVIVLLLTAVCTCGCCGLFYLICRLQCSKMWKCCGPLIWTERHAIICKPFTQPILTITHLSCTIPVIKVKTIAKFRQYCTQYWNLSDIQITLQDTCLCRSLYTFLFSMLTNALYFVNW